MLPDFFVIGAQKSATTTVFRHLEGHPQVEMSARKEPQFFDGVTAMSRDEYEALWSDPDARARGEASTHYSMYPVVTGVPARLTAVVPQARLVYVLRDPIERMVSAWRHGVSRGHERRPLAEALGSDVFYRVTSMYAMQLEQWLRHVPRERILVLRTEDVDLDPAAAMKSVFGFLGVDACHPIDPARRENLGSERRVPLAPSRVRHRPRSRPFRADETVLPDATRAMLTAVLQPDLERLRALLGPGWSWGLLPD